MVRELLIVGLTMTIFELLGRRHGEIDDLFREIQSELAAGHDAEARTRFQTLSTKLIACMRAEHAVVYPRFAFEAGLEDEVRRAIREHDRIEQAINHLRLAPLAPDAWQGAITRLQLLVADHVETEEWILFPVARLRMSTESVTQIAAALEAYEPVAASVAAPSITYFIDDVPCPRAQRDTEPQAPRPTVIDLDTAA